MLNVFSLDWKNILIMHILTFTFQFQPFLLVYFILTNIYKAPFHFLSLICLLFALENLFCELNE